MADPVVTHRPFHFNRRSYGWRQAGQDWELTTAGQVVAQVVPDALYPGMYRVDLGDDPLSDMVNLSRAKDAALSLADRALEKGRQRAQGASPVRQNGLAVPDQPPILALLPGEAHPSGRRRLPKVPPTGRPLLKPPAAKGGA